MNVFGQEISARLQLEKSVVAFRGLGVPVWSTWWTRSRLLVRLLVWISIMLEGTTA